MIASEVRSDIEALMAEYWRRVDGRSAAPPDELFTDHACMQLGTTRCEGRAQLADFYTQRAVGEAANRRTTRHLASGLVIESAGYGRYRVYSTVQVLAGTGDLPAASAPPVTVADFDDLVVEVAPRVWRIERRDATVIFTGAGASSFAR